MNQKKQTIIIVDDLPLNQFILRVLLKPWEERYELVELQNAEGLLQVIKDCKNSKILIFLDLQMPVMDGYDFLTLWKAHKANCEKTVQIVVVSATEISEFKKKGDLTLLQDYLMKPVNGIQIEQIFNSFDQL